MGKRRLSRRLHVWQPCRWSNRQKSEKILARKKWENKNFVEAFSSSKGSRGHVESLIDTQVEKVCKNCQNSSQTSFNPPKSPLEA